MKHKVFRLNICNIIFVIAGILLFVIFIVPLIWSSLPQPRGNILVFRQCWLNLGEIHSALTEYAHDHLGDYPVDLRELYPMYISNLLVFRCLGDKNNSTPLRIDSSIIDADNSVQMSYAYFSGLKVWDEPNTVIITENSADHHGGAKRYGLALNGTFLDNLEIRRRD